MQFARKDWPHSKAVSQVLLPREPWQFKHTFLNSLESQSLQQYSSNIRVYCTYNINRVKSTRQIVQHKYKK